MLYHDRRSSFGPDSLALSIVGDRPVGGKIGIRESGPRMPRTMALPSGYSAQDRPHDLAFGVGQPVLAAVVGEGQAGVVEAQEVQDRGVQVVDVDAVDPARRPTASVAP